MNKRSHTAMTKKKPKSGKNLLHTWQPSIWFLLACSGNFLLYFFFASIVCMWKTFSSDFDCDYILCFFFCGCIANMQREETILHQGNLLFAWLFVVVFTEITGACGCVMDIFVLLILGDKLTIVAQHSTANVRTSIACVLRLHTHRFSSSSQTQRARTFLRYHYNQAIFSVAVIRR